MSATTKAKRQNAVRKNASKKPAKPIKALQPVKRTAKRTPVAVEPVLTERSAIMSAAMRELADVRHEAREERNGKPAKHCVFDLWFAAISKGKRLDTDVVAAKYPEVKPSTIPAWVNAWHNLSNLPSVARGKEKLIAAALKKLNAKS